MQTTELMTALKAEIEAHYPDWRADDFTVIGQGLEGLVCRVNTAPFGTVAVKAPWQRWVVDVNDTMDTREHLRQEAAFAAHLRPYGIPAPAAQHLHLNDDGLDFLASAYVEHDGSAPDVRAMGQLVRAIHDSPCLERRLVAEECESIHQTLALRLSRRARNLERLASIELKQLQAEAIQAALADYTSHCCILHMDARPANILACEGQIVAIVDWTNALRGDPALELARIAESGNLSDAFLAGYGGDAFAHLPRRIETLYRLDTAVMLSLVFLSEAPDAALAERYVQRVKVLHSQL